MSARVAFNFKWNTAVLVSLADMAFTEGRDLNLPYIMAVVYSVLA